MFGYLSAETRLLTQNELDRYKACYCGLCHCLRERHGGLARLTLNYDICFLVLLLQSLYEPKGAAVRTPASRIPSGPGPGRAAPAQHMGRI